MRKLVPIVCYVLVMGVLHADLESVRLPYKPSWWPGVEHASRALSSGRETLPVQTLMAVAGD